MGHRVQNFRLVVLLLVAVMWGCGPPQQQSIGSINGAGWDEGPTSEYVGDELFMWINGGAEIYHEYGFVKVGVREHTLGDERYSVEVYTMADDAFGIYSWARSSTGEPVDLGAGGTLAEYYLHFWSGPHLVVVTAQTPGSDPRATVLELGQRVGADHPMVGSPPVLVDLIPADHCPQGSATYFVGPIAFNNLAPRLATWFAGFDDGVAVDCPVSSGETERIVFLRWSDPSRAVTAIEQAAERINTTEGARLEAIDDDPPEGARLEFIEHQSFTLTFDTGAVAAGLRADHILRITVADGHRPKLDELPFWCEPSRRPS